MQQLFSNATVLWSERDIIERESLIQQLYQTVATAWVGLNPAVRFARVETPVLTPDSVLQSHIAEGFPMLRTERGLLRPETTGGCIAAFEAMFPQSNQRTKRLPFCVWQVGKSFRDETNPDTMRASKLRLVEFYQCEFQLFVGNGTQADYLGVGLNALVRRFGGELAAADELPHYSIRTVDWFMDGLEVAGCSLRKDWPGGMLFEISIGLDRLLVKTLENKL